MGHALMRLCSKAYHYLTCLCYSSLCRIGNHCRIYFVSPVFAKSSVFHLLEKGWPLGSCLWCLIVKLSLTQSYPGSGVVLNCIDSWSLPISYFYQECLYESSLSSSCQSFSDMLMLSPSLYRIVRSYQACLSEFRVLAIFSSIIRHTYANPESW